MSKTPKVETAEGRRKQAAKGNALPDGSFPIPDLKHLKSAIHLFKTGHGKNRKAALALIKRRARELGHPELVRGLSLSLPLLDMHVVSLARTKYKPGHSSRIHPGLNRSPKKNWVENVGGLPDYINRIAKHIHYDSGLTIEHAIRAAIRRCEELAAKGNAEAIKALAEWEAKKGRSKAKTAAKKAGKRNLALSPLVLNLGLVRKSKETKSYGQSGAGFDEAKHPRAPQNGMFAGKISPQELLDARKRVEGAITNLQVGQTYELPNSLGWVKRTEGGYFIQGPAGYSASVSTLSSAVQAAAIILAGKVPEQP